ncbi:LuxR C-terminal-related transcriptional regulator [Deinococcus yavapaiensis]|uniref:Putative ATPase n=1 Tax=Deinococcus yavapaiensis KR-236 TaxID=694435 RepID=A0A318S7S0_9DEIO|nr:LuxR C-terminal-related transcriptional regulator [Deinococcus yavapaiensis]PYE51081.1 putative ATPase [Deinococcus yavapaiensis KR-236]
MTKARAFADPIRFVALPDPMTSLVGREHEVARVRAILNWPQVSLLTLTGPGGVGKTRLAIEVARQLAGQYADGAVFVPLAPVQRHEDVLAVIAQTLGLQESVRPTLDVVGAFLRDRQMLLVLDNFEHVLDAAEDVSALLRAAPDLTVLVTSRACLKLYGEHELPVPPLSLPSEGESGEAGQLFVERVRAVMPSFTLAPDNASVIEDICRRVDGLPLAIELAAARARLLPLRALLARLDNRLGLLAGGARDLPARQQTLRATLDWSHDLLDPHEQALFARLGVFVGGWTWEAAEAICRTSDDHDVLDGLASLVEKSLVQRTDVSGEARFGMLETLREYALEKLAHRQEDAWMRERHARHFARWSEQARLGLEGPGQLEWLGQVEAEQPNVLAAVRERAQARDFDTVARVAWNLGWAWAVRVDDRAERVLEDVMRLDPPRTAHLARLLYARSWLMFRRGRFELAVEHAAQCLALFHECEDVVGEGYASMLLGMDLLPYRERSSEGVRACEVALGVARQRRLPWLEIIANSVAGWLHMISDRMDEAERSLLAALALGAASGEQNVMTWNRIALAAWHARRGEVEAAARLLRDGLASGERMNDPAVTAACLHGLAAVAALDRADELAAHLLGAAEGLRSVRNISPQTEPALFGPLLDGSRARLGEAAFGAALDRGRSWRLVEAIEAAARIGTSSACAASESAAPPSASRDGDVTRLTPSERDVLQLIAAGLSNKQIAARRGTGLYTVNDQVRAIFSKLGVPNRASATRYALEHGLV